MTARGPDDRLLHRLAVVLGVVGCIVAAVTLLLIFMAPGFLQAGMGR